jgi:hypothetical protein
MHRIKVRLAAIVAGLALALSGLALGACSSGPVNYPTPTSYTVSYHGELYCGYQYSEFELSAYGYTGTCTRVAYPSISVVPMPGTLEFALAEYRSTYSSWLSSGLWYDQYYAPLGARCHVTVISRTSYLSNATTFQHTYASQIKNNSAKAQWSGGKKGNYSFPSSNQNAKNKPATNTGGSRSNTGASNVGTDNSRNGSGPLTNSGSKSGSSGSKSGTSSSGGKSGTKR